MHDLKEDLVALSLSNLSRTMNTEVSDTLPLVHYDHTPPMVSLYVIFVRHAARAA